MRCCFAPNRVAVVQKKTKNKKTRKTKSAHDDVEKLEIAGQNVKWCGPCGKQQVLKKVNFEFPCVPAIVLISIYPSKWKTATDGYLYANVHSTAIQNSPKVGNNAKANQQVTRGKKVTVDAMEYYSAFKSCEILILPIIQMNLENIVK